MIFIEDQGNGIDTKPKKDLYHSLPTYAFNVGTFWLKKTVELYLTGLKIREKNKPVIFVHFQ